jgi:hypothetical protein
MFSYIIEFYYEKFESFHQYLKNERHVDQEEDHDEIDDDNALLVLLNNWNEVGEDNDEVADGAEDVLVHQLNSVSPTFSVRLYLAVVDCHQKVGQLKNDNLEC